MIAEFSLQGRTALVTGAGRGIGTGIAEVLAEAGANVAVNALTTQYLDPFVKGLSERSGRRVAGIAGDCTTAAGAAQLVEKTFTALGAIDILVNNLGDAIRKPFEAMTDEEIDKVMGLNIMSAIYCARAVAPQMIARKRGKIINISSFSGISGSANLSVYAVGKTGMVGLTRSLALEWAPHGINVNCIAPGLYPDLAMAGPEQYAKAEERAKTQVPLQRVGKFREVGLLALYLASPASDYMTGQIIPLDGGLTV
jgi:NAD(P)-dependent dehydrogenase (short-subunit alcohol dehydrogenase family)